MSKILQLTISDAKPLRHGLDYLWSLILQLTQESDTFLYRDIKGMSDQDRLNQIVIDLGRLEKAGYLGRLPAQRLKGARPYRLLRRQSETPVLRADGEGDSLVGSGIQNMWNVMRRSLQGFTVSDLAIDASTDEVTVSHQHAKQYCLLLERAGILRKQRTGERGVGRNVYVLLGSANTGPKAPRRYKATFVYDRNRGRVVGPVAAEEMEP